MNQIVAILASQKEYVVNSEFLAGPHSLVVNWLHAYFSYMSVSLKKMDEFSHRKEGKKKSKMTCTSRESNPGLYRGRVLFYH